MHPLEHWAARWRESLCMPANPISVRLANIRICRHSSKSSQSVTSCEASLRTACLSFVDSAPSSSSSRFRSERYNAAADMSSRKLKCRCQKEQAVHHQMLSERCFTRVGFRAKRACEVLIDFSLASRRGSGRFCAAWRGLWEIWSRSRASFPERLSCERMPATQTSAVLRMREREAEECRVKRSRSRVLDRGDLGTSASQARLRSHPQTSAAPPPAHNRADHLPRRLQASLIRFSSRAPNPSLDPTL